MADATTTNHSKHRAQQDSSTDGSTDKHKPSDHAAPRDSAKDDAQLPNSLLLKYPPLRSTACLAIQANTTSATRDVPPGSHRDPAEGMPGFAWRQYAVDE